jgi:uncharacterized membrane protein YbjE (DUF340 family)
MLVSLLILFLCIGLGVGLAKLTCKGKPLLPGGRFVDTALSVSLCLLLFFMGFRVGRIEGIEQKLAAIGLLSFVFALASVLGSVALMVVFSVARRKLRGLSAAERPAMGDGVSFSPRTSLAHLKDPARLMGMVSLGFCVGFFTPLFAGFKAEDISTYMLYLLLFFIGIQLVRNGIHWRDVMREPEYLLLPLVTVAGSLAAGGAVGGFFGLTVGKSLALSSGFGWYSLSGVLISDMGDPVLGSAGFMINLFREGLSLFCIPFLGRFKAEEAAIGVAGATSMDVTLPLIERSCGTRYVPFAIYHGALLSLLVPFLVPLFFRLG